MGRDRAIRCALANLILEECSIRVKQIDLDFNSDPQYPSQKLISASAGYITSLGFEAKAKPNLLDGSLGSERSVPLKLSVRENSVEFFLPEFKNAPDFFVDEATTKLSEDATRAARSVAYPPSAPHRPFR